MSDITVKFGAQDENLSDTLTRIQSHLGRIENASEKTATKMDDGFGVIAKGAAVAQFGVEAAMKAISLATDAAAAVMRGFVDAIDMGGRLADLSKRTGDTAGNLLVLERAFQNTGVGAEKVGPTINKLQKFMEGASDASSKQSETLAGLGLSYLDLAGKAPIDQMQILANRISDVEDPGKRATAAMTIFGKAGGELLPILSDFAGEVQGARNQLGSLPDIMTRSAADFDSLGDSIDGIKSKTMEFASGILESALPALNELTSNLGSIDAAKIGKDLGENIAIALSVIGDEDPWKLFTLNAEKALLILQNLTGGLSAAINAVWDEFTTLGYQGVGDLWTKYADAGMDANQQIYNDIFYREYNYLDRVKNRIRETQAEMAKTAAEAAADAAFQAVEKTQRLATQNAERAADEVFGEIFKEQEATAKRTAEIAERAKNDAMGVKENLRGSGIDLKDNTRDASDNMQQIRTLGDLIKAQDAAAPMKKFNEQVKEARADLKNLKDFIGGDFSRLSIPDIAKKLQIDTANKDQKELFEDIKKKLADLKGKEVDIKINKDATKEDLDEVIKEIQARFEIFGEGSPLEINMTAEKSIVKIKESLKQEVDLALSSSKGTNILEALKSAVDVIKTTVQAIEPKLPQTALGV